MTNATLTPETLAYFLSHARDAANWSGTPCVGGNVAQGHREDGYLTACKKAGLLQTFVSDRMTFIEFTAEGRAFAAEHGVSL